MKTLLLVHVEETFRSFFPDELIRNIKRAIKRGGYGRVIHFTSQVNDDKPVNEIVSFIDTFVDWGWGYEPECFHDEKELEFVIPSYGHEWTWVPPELRKWKQWLLDSDVHLGGGGNSECLADMESVLRHLEIPYKRRIELIY